MTVKIKNRYTGDVVKLVDAETLQNADLRGADLRGADLWGADLRGADLRGANLRGADLKIFQAGRYIAYVTSTHTCIGCQAHDNSTWREFSDGVIGDMASDALEWWKANSAIVFAIMDSLAAEFPVKEEVAA